VRLVYFDEAGSSQDEAQEPIITVASVILHGDLETGPVEHDAEAIIATVPEHLRTDFEFHAKDLFSGCNKFKGWRRSERYAALSAFMELIPKYALPVHAIGIVKKGFWREARHLDILGFTRKSQPHFLHESAFLNCAMAVETWFKHHAKSERGICFADDTKARDKIKSNFRDFRGNSPFLFTGNSSSDGVLLTDFTDSVKFDHLVDMIYFGDSKESIFLQLADCCAFFIKRMMMGRADAKPFYNIIERQVAPQPLRLLFKPKLSRVPARAVAR
jgi:hypothetical protein